jgi:hypothetical protein
MLRGVGKKKCVCRCVYVCMCVSLDMRLWTMLWDPDIPPTPGTSHFGQCLRELPACPDVVPLTGGDIAAVFRGTPAGKAAGYDGWSGKGRSTSTGFPGTPCTTGCEKTT